MSFDAFLAQAWNDHGDRPREVADRLASSLDVIAATENIPAFAHLATHVFGEHLGEWSRGVELLTSLRRLPAYDRAKSARSVDRGIAILRYSGGAGDALDALALEDRVSALATASGAFTGRGRFDRAIDAFTQALELGGAGLPAESPATRSLAVGGNSLAAALEGKKDRDPIETAAMVTAAEAGLTFWKQAGTWLEEERAEYRLARSLLQAGNAATARRSAERCLEICQRNDAPAFERFFAYAVLAFAQRASGDLDAFEAARREALQLFEQLPPDERQWCESDLKELGS